MHYNWKRIALDTLIIYALTFLGGFIVGFVAGVTNSEVNNAVLTLTTVVFTTAGFAYSSYKAGTDRWTHLFAVGVALWLVSATNVLFGLSSVAEWAFGIVLIIVLLGVGGGIGMLLAKNKSSQV